MPSSMQRTSQASAPDSRRCTKATMTTYGTLVLTNTDIDLLFAHDDRMFPGPSNRRQFVVTCKRCHLEVPSGVKEFPFHSIVVTCSLCGEQRQYLPSEVILGRPHQPETRRA